MTTLIFGAGGHALEVVEVARRCGQVRLDADTTYFVIGGPSSSRRESLPFPVIHERELGGIDRGAGCEGVVAVGSSEARAGIVSRMEACGLDITYPNLIDPSAVVSRDAGHWRPQGIVVFPLAFVSERVSLGRHCHVNTFGLVGHEAVLGDFVTLAARASVCGRASIGERSYLGASSTVIDDVAVTAGTTVGAGAVVVRDIDAPGTYVGVPARPIADPDARPGISEAGAEG